MSEQAKVVDIGTMSAEQLHQHRQEQLNRGIMVLQTWRRIIGLRIILLLVTLGAMGIWCYAAIDPLPMRSIVAGGYSLGVLLPMLVLYFKRSE